MASFLETVNVCPSEGSRKPATLPRLTGLRFFAAVAVVLTHVGYRFTSISFLRTTETYGYEGVGLFFLLSGFVLKWAFQGQATKKFWWQRFSKVWPAQLMMAVFAFVALGSSERIPGPWGKVADLTLLQAWWPKAKVYYGGNGVSWSLSCEIFFYLLFPLLVVWVARLRLRGTAILVGSTLIVLMLAPIGAAYLGVSQHMSYWLFFVFPPYQLGSFLLGMAVAHAMSLGIRVKAPRATALASVLWLGMLAVVYTEYSVTMGHPVQRPAATLLAMPAFVLLIMSCATSDVRKRASWLTSKSIVYLGAISFELYLIHKPLYLYSEKWKLWHNPGGLAGVLYFIAYLSLCLVAAALFHRFFERPVERWLRKNPMKDLGLACRKTLQRGKYLIISKVS